MKTLIAIAVAALFVSAPTAAQTQAPDALRAAAQQAVAANPEVQALWHAFRSAEFDQDAARAGYLPRVDVSAGVGRDTRRRPGEPTTTVHRRGAEVALVQMLYDGFFTRSEVERFGHARLTRYFELLSGAEDVAFEAVRAYADVLRYRELVELAKHNYVEHKLIHEQIAERVRAGVGRGVDLEQATGRLALSESNLLTEISNLHDVGARYLRVVGERADDALPPLPRGLFDAELPDDVRRALETALADNPLIKAALANVRAAESLIETRRSPFHPRVDFRARQSLDHNAVDIDGRSRDGVVEVVMTYNLYRGGADQARLRGAAEDLNRSRDLREKACRDVRQSLAIAWNNVQRLDEQLVYLDQHQLSTEKSRQAYRQQFDIGQRTLLDLLDTENEYFEARRAYVNAIYDQYAARARSLAAMGRLLGGLGVARAELPSVAELAGDDSAYAVDPASICPPDAPEMLLVDKEALLVETLRTHGGRR